MKKIFLLCTSLFFTANLCFAQESGMVTYAYSRDWVKFWTVCDYIPKAQRDRMAYVWGGDEDSKWDRTAELKFNADEYRFEYIPDDESGKWRMNDYIVYRDRAQGETFDVLTLLSKDYVIQDSIVSQQWKIKNDIKEVAGRICMNAVTYDSIKGKEIVAWFALDLPIPLGPDKYCGLPGMILEVDEANGAVIFTATSILFTDEKMEIEKPTVKKKRKVITLQEYNNILIKYMNECKKMERPFFLGIPF
jgi:GLPGLI family protein